MNDKEKQVEICENCKIKDNCSHRILIHMEKCKVNDCDCFQNISTDNKKQIEEMAKVVCKNYMTETCASGRCTLMWECPLNYKTVEILYEQGYRKLPEDSVVLSREEYKRLLDNAIRVDMEYLDHELAKERKETAEKILSEIWHNKFETIITIKNSCSKEDVENIGKEILISIRNKLKEIATREGVEIKE